MTTSEIRLNFYKGTGLKYDFDKIVEVYKDANKEDKIQLFRELQWKAPAGIISTGSPKATYIANALTGLAKELGLTLPDIDENGILDSNERWIKTKIDILEDSDNEGEGNDDNKDPQEPEVPKVEISVKDILAEYKEDTLNLSAAYEGITSNEISSAYFILNKISEVRAINEDKIEADYTSEEGKLTASTSSVDSGNYTVSVEINPKEGDPFTSEPEGSEEEPAFKVEPKEPEQPEEPKEQVPDETILWGDFFGDEGSAGTFSTALPISEYQYTGIEGYKDNKELNNVQYIGNDGVRISTATAGNITSGALWFNGTASQGDTDGIFEVKNIKLYDVKTLTFGYSQSGAKIKASYCVNNSWTEFGETSANENNVFHLSDIEAETIDIKFEHTSTEKNTRIDNIRLVAGNVDSTSAIAELIAKYSINIKK